MTAPARPHPELNQLDEVPALLELLDDEPLEIERGGDATDLARQPFPTVHLMDGEAPPAPSMLVDGLVIDSDISLLTGPGGVGKSPILLTTAVCVAIDRPVFGTLAVRRHGPVLLVLPEDGQAVARTMLDAIAAAMDLTPSDRQVLQQRLVMVSDDVRVNVTRDAARLRDTADAIGAVWVAIDPLRNVLGAAEENANDVAGQVCDALRREVCRKTGAALTLTHHHRKQGRDAGENTAPSRDDVRGGAGWVDGARLALGVRKQGNRITITSLKANRVANTIRHDLELTIIADAANAARWTSCSLTDANGGASTPGAPSQALIPGVGRPINDNERRALEAIDDRHEPGRRVPPSEWTKTSGLNPETLKTIKRRLLDAGLAAAHAAGQHRNGGKLYNYAITERGRDCLSTGMVEGERVRG